MIDLLVLSRSYQDFELYRHSYSIARIVNSPSDVWIDEDALFFYKELVFLLRHITTIDNQDPSYFALFLASPNDDPKDVGAFSVNILQRICKGYDVYDEKDLIDGCNELIVAEIYDY